MRAPPSAGRWARRCSSSPARGTASECRRNCWHGRAELKLRWSRKSASHARWPNGTG
jgi:hypothetical protein